MKQKRIYLEPTRQQSHQKCFITYHKNIKKKDISQRNIFLLTGFLEIFIYYKMLRVFRNETLDATHLAEFH